MLRNKIQKSEGDKHIHLILKWERPLNKGGSLKMLKEVHKILNLFKGRIYYKWNQKTVGNHGGKYSANEIFSTRNNLVSSLSPSPATVPFLCFPL